MTFLRRRLLPVFLFLLGTAVFFCTGFGLSRAHNDFPPDYQPDEPSKAEQILNDERNFHHPLLMLNAADWAATWQKTPREATAITQVGRDVSAVFAGAAAVLLAWAGLVTEGWAGFVLVGLAASLCPAVISHSHYFKEEASLIFGVGCVVFAGSLLCRAKRAPAILGASTLLGAACGVAASGKYPGAIFLAPSILLVLTACGRRWFLARAARARTMTRSEAIAANLKTAVTRWDIVPFALLLLLAAAVGSWSGINWRAVQNWDDFTSNYDDEQRHATTDHMGVTMDQPNGFFVHEVIDEAMPHVAVLCLIAPVALMLQRRRISFGFWLIGLGAVYLVMLSYSVIPFYRYAVPVTLLLHVLAAMAVVWMGRLAIGVPLLRGLIIGLGVGVIGYAQLQRCLNYDNQFAHDSRTALRDWLAAGVAPGALIAADDYVMLHDIAPERLTLFRRDSTSAADYGSVDSLRRRGFAYVITAGTRCERYLSPYVHGAPGETDHFNRRRTFYETLARDYPVVWQIRADEPMQTFANPDITVYRLFPLHNTR